MNCPRNSISSWYGSVECPSLTELKNTCVPPSSCPVSLLFLLLKCLLLGSSGFFTPPFNLAKQQIIADLQRICEENVISIDKVLFFT